MKHLYIILLILLSGSVSGQYILKGSVSDPAGIGIPGVRIYVENTTYGVISDYNGNYFMEFPEAKTYSVRFRMIGMADTVMVINLTKSHTILDVVLQEEAKKLGEVEVVAKKENIANNVIRHVQDNRKYLSSQYENFSCVTYFKTALEKEARVVDEEDSATAEPMKMGLLESVSHTTFIQPSVYNEKIIAHHDYSDKVESATSSVIDYYDDDVIVPMQQVMVDPYIFFEKTADGDFDLYQSMLNLPKITEFPITSPVGVNAFVNYRYKLADIFYEGEQKIYEIQVIPLFKTAPLLSGTLYIIDSLWVIKSFNLSVNTEAMLFFKEFNVIQDYELVEGFWVPVRREFTYTIREEGYLITANTRVNHSNYQFNQVLDTKEFRNEILSYSDDAFSKDSSFWNNERPIQLKTEELLFIDGQNRIDSIKQSERYLDSVDADFNRVTFWDVTLNGTGFRNRFKEQEIYFAPLLGNIQIFGVGGFRYDLSGYYSKKFENRHAIKITPGLNYGFATRDLKARLAAEYTFRPLKFGMVEFEIGDKYERLTNQLSAVNWLLGGNSSVRNQFVSVGYRQELVNGLYGKIKFSYSDKSAIDSMSQGPLVDYILATDTFNLYFNEPPEFERYRMALIEFKFQYRFRQQYIVKKGEKLIIGTEYPELELAFKQGIPTLFGSEVSFNFIEFKVSDEINFGNFGDSKWKFIGGSFLNKTDLRIVEHKYFKQSDYGFFSNPLNTHQTLDTSMNTNDLYLQGFYLHHFNRFLLGKIPLINKLKFEEIAGVSFLLIPDNTYFHAEFFVGIERKFKVLNQSLKYGLYYTSGFNNLTQPYFKFKFGVDFLNTFTNKWSY